MLDEKAVSGGRRVDDDGRDLPVLELKAELTGGVLVKGQCPLKRPKSFNSHLKGTFCRRKAKS